MNLKLLALAVPVFIFYVFASSLSFEPGEPYYNLQTDALLAGRLDLGIFVDSTRLIDPKTDQPNWFYLKEKHILDLSVYHGKVYSYFGITPVLTLYLPCQILTGRRVSDRFAALFFGFGAFLWSLALLRHLRTKYIPDAPKWMFWLAAWLLGFANFVPLILRPHGIYEITIASGLFFLLGSLFFLCSAFGSESSVSTKKLAAASLFLGLSIGCRPHLFPIAIALLAKTVLRFFEKKLPTQTRLKNLAALLLPFGLSVTGWMIYNWARFDNPFEAGRTYLTTDPGGTLFHPSRILPSLYFVLLRPPVLGSHFPYLHIGNQIPCFIKSACPLYIIIENSVGLLTAVPFVLFAFFAGYVLKRRARSALSFDFSLFALPATMSLCLFLLFNGICSRYLADLATLFLFSSILIWFELHRLLEKSPAHQRLLGALALAVGIFCIYSGIVYPIDMQRIDYQGFYDCLNNKCV